MIAPAYPKPSTPLRPKAQRGSRVVQPFRDKRAIEVIKSKLTYKPRDLALFTVGICTGYRGGDLLALRWADVLTEDNRIVTHIRITESKTRKCIPRRLHDNAQKALMRLLRASSSVQRDDCVFPSREGVGQKMTTGRLSQLVRGWAKSANLEGRFGAHSLRKTTGYHMRKANYDLALIMDIFGHTSPAVTLRYCGITQDEMDEAVLALDL